MLFAPTNPINRWYIMKASVSVSDLRHTATYSWKARILPKLIIPSASNVEQVSGTSSERPEKNNPYQLIYFRAISNLRLTRMTSMKPYKKVLQQLFIQDNCQKILFNGGFFSLNFNWKRPFNNSLHRTEVWLKKKIF